MISKSRQGKTKQARIWSFGRRLKFLLSFLQFHRKLFFLRIPGASFFSFEIFKMSFCSSFLHPTFLSFFSPNFLSFFLFSQALALSVLLLRFPIWEILHLAWSGHLLQQTKTKNNDFKLKKQQCNSPKYWLIGLIFA